MSARRYNANKRKWGLVHYKSMEPMVEVLEYGAHKYTIFRDKTGKEIKGADITPEEAADLEVVSTGENNWKSGLDKREILESMQRHLAYLMDGQDLDEESKIHHMGHILCNGMFYNYFNVIKKPTENE